MHTQNGAFHGTALLKDRITEIKARATVNGEPREIRTRAVWAKNSYRRFRCYIDDHSFCFRDICRENYKSIFDCFYLAKLRELHRNFGVKINLNCFNTTPERDFRLSMFPDKYKSEFEDNAHWLRLAFHSENEFPDIPYKDATPEQLAADFDLVAKELKRIAGSAYIAGHEQYWWPFYKNFVPDIYERYAAAFRFVLDRGYRSIWIEDGFFGGAEEPDAPGPDRSRGLRTARPPRLSTWV
mgnify:CR=1 FL=1